MHPLTTIVCGPMPTRGAAAETLKHLAESLDRLLTRTMVLVRAADPYDLALFGPFLGRASIEVAFTAILGRFDPFRVLAIRKSQATNNYDPRQRNPLAFSWTNDVSGDEKPKEWEQRPGLKDLQRALLCRHFNDVFWQEAFTNLIDETPGGRGAEWMVRLRRIAPEAFTTAMRSNADRVYSELSKGVHHEFVIPAVAQYDEITVKDLVSRCWELIAGVALAACFSPVLPPMQGGSPLDHYEAVQQEIQAA